MGFRLDMAVRAICKDRNEHNDICIALKQPDGTTTCACGKRLQYLRDAQVAIEAADRYTDADR